MAEKKSEVEEIEERNRAVDARQEDQRQKADEMAQKAEERNQAIQRNLERQRIRLGAACRIAGITVVALLVIAALAICASANLMHQDLAFLIQAVLAAAAAGRVGFLSAVIKFV